MYRTLYNFPQPVTKRSTASLAVLIQCTFGQQFCTVLMTCVLHLIKGVYSVYSVQKIGTTPIRHLTVALKEENTLKSTNCITLPKTHLSYLFYRDTLFSLQNYYSVSNRMIRRNVCLIHSPAISKFIASLVQYLLPTKTNYRLYLLLSSYKSWTEVWCIAGQYQHEYVFSSVHIAIMYFVRM